MGKQSSGKSFLLNHLSGSLFDVAGGRCTDGVWMIVRMDSECLYVLMDFEGLGIFERTEQEDMLLSVLNAALSNLTIFNKKDFHLDKETEVIFQRFQERSESIVELKNSSQTSVKSLPSSFTSRYAENEPRKDADVIVKALEREGVEHVFAYPGGASVEIHQELTRSKIIKNVLCRHEQGEVFAAEGYARSTGKVAV